MKKSCLFVFLATMVAGCGHDGSTASTSAPAQTSPSNMAGASDAGLPRPSGIESSSIDTTTRAQDDFYQYANGAWLKAANIPADRALISADAKLKNDKLDHLHGIVEAAAQSPAEDADVRKVGDLYASFMDEPHLQELGVKPLVPVFARIDDIKDKRGMSVLMASLSREAKQPDDNGLPNSAPCVVYIHQDNKDATRYVADLQQSGLGLPDRDYYVDNEPRFVDIRAKYLRHIEKMLTLAGDHRASADATSILALETALARLQWTEVELRDPVKAYNKISITALPGLAPGFDWAAYLGEAGVASKENYVIAGQPSYLIGFAKLFDKTPLPVWKAYFKWRAVNDLSPFLSKEFVDEHFAFYGMVLNGTLENRPRWKRGLDVVEEAMGEALGKEYVARFVAAGTKERAHAIVDNVLATFGDGIDNLDWMGATTKQAAREKLAKIAVKVGYPDRFRDYTRLQIARDDLVGNIRHSRAFEYDRNLAKLGAPIDRSEWEITPQTLSANYDPERNELTLPAAFLQAPYFDPKVDDAANYGGIGVIIGHEISHAFDDQGAQYDGDGNLRDWWSKEDRAKFSARTKVLVEQYSAYEPIPGYHLNGELTLGENIADNSGISVAYKAYRRSLSGRSSPRIDGFSGDQRFFLSFAQSWGIKVRDDFAVKWLKTDPHSIPVYRVIGSLVNQPAFYDAFQVKVGDKMYLPPDKQVHIW